MQEDNEKFDNYLANSSLSSCSDTNCPKLATNSVEHGAFAARGGLGGCEPPVDPPGLACKVKLSTQ